MKHSQEFEALVAEVMPRVVEIDIETLLAEQAKGAPLRLIDVREDGEWSAGRLALAEHIGRGVLERDIIAKVPDKETELVLYCGGGYRSALAADNLQKMGYRNVRSLRGGYREWIARGLPTQR